MDVGRLLDLYAAETEEHLRLLQQSLLAVERSAGTEAGNRALDEAFRAAHTLKGISAAMGFAAAAAQAHQLEDRLDSLRSGAGAVPDFDALFADADLLERSIATAHAAVGTPQPLLRGAGASPGTGTPPHAATVDPWADAPAGAAAAAVVRLREDAQVKAARALLVLRALEPRGDVLGSRPAEFGEDFDGTFTVHFSTADDMAAVESAIRGAGEVELVRVFVASGLERAVTGAAPASGARPQLRVDADRLDGLAGGIGELSILFGRVAGAAQGHGAADEALDRMGFLLRQLQQEVVDLRMVPVGGAFERLPRVVRDAARRLGREVDLELHGEDVKLDRALMEELADPLIHVLRNAVDHGIEPASARVAAGKPPRGVIRVRAERDRSSVCITVADDGAGVSVEQVVRRARDAGLPVFAAGADPTDEDLFRLLSHPGLSTAASVGEVSGRGVGMDVVVSRVRAMGGAIDMKTGRGVGTSFTIRLPVTLALAEALRVRVGDEDYAIPLTHVSEAVELAGGARHGEAAASLRLRGETLPLVSMRSMLQVKAEAAEGAAVIAGSGGRRMALMVDEVIGREQILVRPFDAAAGTLPFFSGATLIADGRPVLVIDPLSVL
jgi:two-component system, chemotaxis family, sensor kinase CheA